MPTDRPFGYIPSSSISFGLSLHPGYIIHYTQCVCGERERENPERLRCVNDLRVVKSHADVFSYFFFFLICVKEKDFPLGGKFLHRSRTVIGFRDSDYTAADKKFPYIQDKPKIKNKNKNLKIEYIIIINIYFRFPYDTPIFGQKFFIFFIWEIKEDHAREDGVMSNYKDYCRTNSCVI